MTRKVRVGGLNFWAFEVGWVANSQLQGDTPKSAEMNRDFTISPLRAVRAAGEGNLAIIRTLSFAETRFEPVEYLV